MRPTRPYTTCAPACSSARAQTMLFSSSKRALISTRTTTCLPCSAARMSARTIGESPEVRYSVCLIVRTSGSSAAWEMNFSTEAVNDSYGWCRKMSPARICANRSTGSSSSVGMQPERDDRDVRRRLEVRAVEVDELPQGGEVHHPGDLERVLVADVDALHEDLAGQLGHRALDLEPHGIAEPPAPDLLLDREQEIVRLVLLDRDVGVAGHPEQVRLDDLHAPEQLVQVRLDDLVEEDELVAPDREQAGEQGRDLDPGEAVLARLRVQQPDGDREAERGDVRERVPRVDGERREDREDLVVEPAAERLVVLRDVVVVEDRDALGAQLLADPRPDRRVVRRQLPDADADLGQLLGRRHAVRRVVRGARLGLAPEAGHADLEELVQVGREDREELHPLQQGIARVTRLVEHPRVELDPRQLAVEDRPPLVAREATAWSAGGSGSGCGSNGGHGSSAMPGTRRAARDDTTPRSRRAPENTTRPRGSRHPGRVRIRLDQASGTYRRSPDDGSIQTCIATPVVGSTNRSSVGRNRPSGALRLAAARPVAVAGLLGVERPVPGPLEEHGRDHHRARDEQEQRGHEVRAGSARRGDGEAAQDHQHAEPADEDPADDHRHGATRGAW